jgi:hypothetical protein
MTEIALNFHFSPMTEVIFGMIDLNVSIFITIGLDCCNSYSKKAFYNSCRCDTLQNGIVVFDKLPRTFDT